MRLIQSPARRPAHRNIHSRPGCKPATTPVGARRPTRSRTGSCTTPPTDNQPPTAPRSPVPARCSRPAVRRLVLVAEVASLALLVSASTAHAETTQVLALAGSVSDVLNNVRNWLMGILALLATVFLSIGGVRYVMGGGDPSEVEKAKTAFKSAGIGYALAALAPLIVAILQGIVGGP
jgi:Type IV secretion system pilin